MAYKFELDINATVTRVFPTYPATAERNFSREPEQVFFRGKLNAQLTFLRDDFDLIDSEDLETEFILIISEWDVSGAQWVELSPRYIFKKTDCRIDQDNKIIQVQPTPKDNYEKILAAMDKEFDLIKMALPTTPVTVKRQPIFQIYIAGRSRITNFIGSIYWEQEAINATDNVTVLTQDFHFTQAGNLYGVNGYGSVSGIAGEYDLFTTNVYRHVDNTFDVEYDVPTDTCNIKDVATGTIQYAGVAGEGFGTTYTGVGGNTGEFTLRGIAVFMRMICATETVGGAPTVDAPGFDIVPENPNYPYIYKLTESVFQASALSGTTVTRWSQVDENTPVPSGGNWYWEKPNYIATLYPVNRSEWEVFSIWMNYSATMATLQADGSEEIEIKDCYELGDVIEGLLSEIDSTIVFDKTSTHSRFLYDTNNPVTEEVNRTIFLTPKSNLLVDNYDQPASKAFFRVRDVFNLLKYAFKVFWYLDSSNNIIFEHIRYFERGKNYSTTTVGTDLTGVNSLYSGDLWTYKTDNYIFEKTELPEEISIKWMDDVSDPFQSEPIKITSLYVQEGNREERQISNFTSDVDFMLGSAAEVAKTGFALFSAALDGGIYKTAFLSFTIGTDSYYMQNGHLSFYYLFDRYHRNNAPAENLEINGAATTALSVQRRRVQDITTVVNSEPDPMQLVTTNIGSGEVGEMSVRLQSDGTPRKVARFKIKHNNS